MAYQENKPLASDRLKDSQSDIQGNFQSNKTSFDQNHVTFDIANTGKHKFIQMPNQSDESPPVDPSGSIGAGEIGLYCKDDFATNQQLFVKNGSGTEFPFTAFLNNIAGDLDEGWTFLPSGLLLKWGYVPGAGARDADSIHLFPVSAGTIPVFSNPVFTVIVTGLQAINKVVTAGGDQNVQTQLRTFSTTQIVVFNQGFVGASGGGHDFTYLAIGLGV